MAWVLSPDALAPDDETAVAFLDHLLTGRKASPLQKALLDSGLGEALWDGTTDVSLRQAAYSVGLKGVKPGDAGKVRCCCSVRPDALCTG